VTAAIRTMNPVPALAVASVTFNRGLINFIKWPCIIEAALKHLPNNTIGDTVTSTGGILFD